MNVLSPIVNTYREISDVSKRFFGQISTGLGATFTTSSLSNSGVVVSETTALNSAAVFRAIDNLGDGVAMLPTQEFTVEGDMLIKSIDGPIVDLLENEPNPEQTPYTFKKWMQNNIVMRGNGYAQIMRDANGYPIQLWPLRADLVEMRRLKNGDLIYLHNTENGQQSVIREENMLHIRGFHASGLVGIALLKIGEQAIGSAVAKSQYTDSFFKNGAVPDYALVHPGKLTPQAQDNLRREWEAQYGGSSNAHKIGILGEGTEVKMIGVNPQDSQLIASSTFSVQEIARVFNMPPHRVMDLSNAALANIAQQGVEYITYTLGPWHVNWSQQLEHDLYSRDTRMGFRIIFDTSHFLKSDPKQMNETLRTSVQGGFRTPNEARKMIGLNPHADGDHLFMQLAMTTIENIIKQAEAEPEPESEAAPEEPSEDDESEEDTEIDNDVEETK